MYVSDWFPEDGVVEAFAYLSAPSKNALLSPVMRLRALRNSDGSYEAVLRDPGTGVLLDHDEQSCGLNEAKHRAMLLAHRFLKAAASTPKPTVKYRVGWYKSAPEVGSTGTHLTRITDIDRNPICGEEIPDSQKRWVSEQGGPVGCAGCRTAKRDAKKE